MEYKNILWPANLKRLVKEGGMYQIPCLFIDGKPMYESDDIIGFLRANFPEGKPL